MSNESVSSKSASGIEGVESRFCIACLLVLLSLGCHICRKSFSDKFQKLNAIISVLRI